MTKEEILDYFKDINGAYNNCNMHDDLSHMLDELLKEQDKLLHKKQKDIDKLCCDIADLKHRFHEKTEIVRCKDCKNQNWINLETGNVICRIGHGTNPSDWYCADAWKRE